MYKFHHLNINYLQYIYLTIHILYIYTQILVIFYYNQFNL